MTTTVWRQKKKKKKIPCSLGFGRWCEIGDSAVFCHFYLSRFLAYLSTGIFAIALRVVRRRSSVRAHVRACWRGEACREQEEK